MERLCGLPVFNYSVVCDYAKREPLFYELYPGSLNDISQLTCMIDKAHGYGYRHIGFILDRGYFSKGNLEYIKKRLQFSDHGKGDEGFYP